MNEAYIAVDLGAESGRVIAIQLTDARLTLHEIHRFANQPVSLPSGLHWDISHLWQEIVAGLTKTASWAKTAQVQLISVGVDAWGVDWALLTRSGELVGLPHAYRDDRYPAACAEALKIVGADEIYATTGIQLMPINTIFSLFAQKLSGPELFASAAQLLFIPDLFHYWLSGNIAIEATIASTSQLIDVHSGAWAQGLLTRLGLPPEIFSPTCLPGTVLGTIRPSLVRATGLPVNLQVVLPPSHDTASAVAAVPVTGSKSPLSNAVKFSRVMATVHSVSRLLLSTVLGVALPSMTTTPSVPQSNFRVAPRPLSAPTFCVSVLVHSCRFIFFLPLICLGSLRLAQS